MRHDRFVTRVAAWGSLLEARVNAAEVYRAPHSRERRWARAGSTGVAYRDRIVELSREHLPGRVGGARGFAGRYA